MSRICLRRYSPKDPYDAAQVIHQTYKEFNRKEGTRKAVADYLKAYDPKTNLESIKKRFSRSTIFYVAVHKGKVVGMIRNMNNRLINLFLLGKYHGKGIGKLLMRKFEQDCIRKGYSEMKMNASLYATKFYQSLGYKKTTGIRKLHGLKVQPMKKYIGAS